jgi:hypothetical protein
MKEPLLRGYSNLLEDYQPRRGIPCKFFGTEKRCAGNAHMAVIGSLGMALKSCDQCSEYEPKED